MLLFVSLRILSCKHLVSLYCDYANDLLVKFVKGVEVLYGKDTLVYNVHCLVHLAVDVKKLGCIQEFTAFPSESKLEETCAQVTTPHTIDFKETGWTEVAW